MKNNPVLPLRAKTAKALIILSKVAGCVAGLFALLSIYFSILNYSLLNHPNESTWPDDCSQVTILGCLLVMILLFLASKVYPELLEIVDQ